MAFKNCKSGKHKSLIEKSGKAKPVKEKIEKERISVPEGWYYMLKEEMSAEKLAGLLAATEYDIEVWKEAGIIEIGIAEKLSLDLELSDRGLQDPFSTAFLEKNGIRTVYYLSAPSEAYETCRPAMDQILAIAGGMICGDTEDFEPILRG